MEASSAPPSGSPACFVSCDIGLELKIKIESLADERPEGMKEAAALLSATADEGKQSYAKLHCDREVSEVYVTCQLFSQGAPISLCEQTAFTAFSSQIRWHEWLTFHIKYKDLPLDAVAAFTVWDVTGPSTKSPVGGTSVALFGKSCCLRKGNKKLQLWTGVEADGNGDSATPSKIVTKNEMDKIEKKIKRYDRGEVRRTCCCC